MINRLAGWQVVFLAGLIGAIAAFGQAPYDLPLLMLAAMIGAVYLFNQAPTPRRAAWVGWAFGTGYFMHALQWIVSPFMVDVARHGWMAPFALVFLSAGLAIFWGAAFWGARKLSPARAWPLILCWPAAELIRAYIFTGFPWAMPSQIVVGTLSGQALAWVGPYALTVWLVSVAVLFGTRAATARLRMLQNTVFIGTVAVLILPPISDPIPLTDHTIRLIQPNAPQREKWDPEKIPVFYDRQLALSAAPPKDGGNAPDLVVWSETAIPWALDLAGSALTEISIAARAPVVLGVQRRGPSRFYNSLVVLGPGGEVAQTYDKHHLVPFGEYMPFGDTLAQFGIHGLAAREGDGYSAGPGAQLLDFGALGTALPLICYEAVFAHDVNAAPTRPAFLIQITNDAWFGKAAGPRQHLAQARMRAIEQGLPMARAANTGISAMIDPYGRITASLPLNAAGFVDAPLPAPLPPTLYSRTGDLPLGLLLLIGLCAAGLGGLRWNRIDPRRGAD
ncbi:MAG: apolipoprotein N-acyltransferase [Sulfitobacter sp.]